MRAWTRINGAPGPPPVTVLPESGDDVAPRSAGGRRPCHAGATRPQAAKTRAQHSHNSSAHSSKLKKLAWGEKEANPSEPDIACSALEMLRNTQGRVAPVLGNLRSALLAYQMQPQVAVCAAVNRSACQTPMVRSDCKNPGGCRTLRGCRTPSGCHALKSQTPIKTCKGNLTFGDLSSCDGGPVNRTQQRVTTLKTSEIKELLNTKVESQHVTVAEVTDLNRLARSCVKKRKEKEVGMSAMEIDTIVIQADDAAERSSLLPLVKGQETRSPDSTLPATQEPPILELTNFEAFEISERMNLPPGEVTQAWKLFQRYDSRGRGVLTNNEFQLLLRASLRDKFPLVRDIPQGLLQRSICWNDAVVFNDFLTWITQNSFSEEILLSGEQREIRQQARDFGVPVPSIEAIKRSFDSFDMDKSGIIEYSEFRLLLLELLNVKTDQNVSLPERRVRSFWREMDIDCSGYVSFTEFAMWYLRHFDVSGRPVGASPLEEFYASIRPVPNTADLFFSG